jgi:UDP-3-O-[3-hydroxymyristoyl] glucosamine N-acyltransferase
VVGRVAIDKPVQVGHNTTVDRAYCVPVAQRGLARSVKVQDSAWMKRRPRSKRSTSRPF